MSALTALTIADARARLAAREISARELTEAHIAAMEAGRGLNAFVAETFELARAAADAADARLAKGDGRLLEGIPLAVKDLFCTRGVRSQACSKILEGFQPPYESTVTANLWAAGALMLGKTNMDEFAMGSANVTSAEGPVINPWRREGDTRPLVPGGSSGGSAAAVAAGLCPGATGTDTGGSIRQPAAFCGIVGMKPTYGRCSRWGMIAFASSLDQAGPLTRTVEDAALMLQAMAGHDRKDSTSIDRPVPDYRASLTGDVRGLTIGVPAEYRMEGMPAEIEALWAEGVRWFRDAGRHGRRHLAPAHQVRAAHLLHRGAGGGVLQPRALRRRPLRAARRGRRSGGDVRPHPGCGLRGAKSSGASSSAPMCSPPATTTPTT